MGQAISMNAVAFEEGDFWVVQGIEYNLVALSRTVQDVPKAFANAIIERLAVAEHLGVDPFQGLGPAPAHFHQMFESALTEVKLARPLGGAAPTVRLAEAA